MEAQLHTEKQFTHILNPTLHSRTEITKLESPNTHLSFGQRACEREGDKEENGWVTEYKPVLHKVENG